MGDFLKQGTTIFAKKDCILFLCLMKSFFIKKRKKRKEKEPQSLPRWFYFMDLNCIMIVLNTIVLGQNLATKLIVALNYTTLLNIFLLKVNFDKSIIGLYLFLISSILAKFLEN